MSYTCDQQKEDDDEAPDSQPEANDAQSESTDVQPEAAEGDIENAHEDICPNNNYMENEKPDSHPEEMDIYYEKVQGLKRQHGRLRFIPVWHHGKVSYKGKG